MTNPTTFSALNQAIATSQELLTTYAFSDELLGDLTTAFGSEYNRDAAEDLVTQWQTEDFNSFPEIEIRNSAEINGANGAYSVDTNKIYIAEEYLLTNADNINAVSDLVLEEYGHYVDAQINPVDAFGDEGDIFAGLVQGQSFTDEQLQQLKLENDRAVVAIDGSEISIEQNNGINVEANIGFQLDGDTDLQEAVVLTFSPEAMVLTASQEVVVLISSQGAVVLISSQGAVVMTA
ncbi:MAG: hypothetical protein QNJ41_26775 [Xenococcaceae cyanobacterium MO_188.B32]|nr:hypothetical protein [Xenococcaceae cyanobacterium MO_188.B32]